MNTADSQCRVCRSPLPKLPQGSLCAACRLEDLLGPASGESAGAGVPAWGADAGEPHRFGGYELLEEVGRGGMGVIYKARQPGLERVVALKMLLAGEFADAKSRDRLLKEARIASGLSHPGIVTIHEVGEIEGRPYFAMEYVPGPNLSQHCREGLMPVGKAAECVERLALAVEYAHRRGVVHRDLKPANVLLTPDGEPKLTDFGLTKSLVEATGTLESAGSPNFMAPEQADCTLGTTGTATDVYGLGAILYYLLTGRPPAVGETLAETLRSVAAGEVLAPRRLRPTLPEELETVVLKCLEREPARRYPGAQEVAEDLARWRRHEPVRARPATPGERATKWIRRHPVVAALSAAVALSLLGGFVGVLGQWRRAEAQAESTARANYAANLGNIRQRIDEGSYVAARRMLSEMPERFRGWEWGRLLSLAHREIFAATVLTNGWTGFLDRVPSPESTFGHTSSPDRRWIACWGSGRLEILSLSNEVSVFRAGSGTDRVHDAAFSPDGALLVTAGPGNGFTLWKTADWTTVRSWGREQERPLSARFSPDGRRIATADGTGRVRILRASDGTEERVLTGGRIVCHTVRFSPNGAQVIGTELRQSGMKPATVWSVEDGRILGEAPGKGEGLRSVEVAPDGLSYATTDHRGVAAAWRLGEDRPYFQTPAEGPDIRWAALAPDHPRMVTLRYPSHQARFWNLETGLPLAHPSARFDNPAIGSDGRTLISIGNALVHVWDWTTGQPSESFGIADIAIQGRVDVSADGRLATALAGHFPTPSTLHAWPLQSTDTHIAPANSAFRAAMSPDGETVALGHIDSRISLWRSRTGERIGWLEGHFRQVNDLLWSRDGRTLVSAAADHTVRIWDVASRSLRTVFPKLESPVWKISATPDGRHIAAAELSGRVTVWDSAEGRVVRSWMAPADTDVLPVYEARISPGGGEVVLTGFGASGVWSVETGRQVVRFTPPGDSGDFDPCGVGFNRDGTRLASVDRSGRLRIWDTRTWTVLRTTEASEGAVELVYSKDGRRLFLTVCQAISPVVGEVGVEVHDGETGLPLFSSGRRRGWGTRIDYDDARRRVMHVVMDNGDPTHGVDLWEALPWRDSDFPGLPGVPLESRVQILARSALWSRLSLPSVPPQDPGVPSPEPRSNWKARLADTPASCVDLTAAYNGHLETGWEADVFIETYGNNLSALPQGNVRLDGVDWDVRGVVTTGQTSSGPLRPWRAGRRVDGIPVRGSARTLHFLHGFSGGREVAGRVGKYVLHYRDGSTADLAMVAGEDVGDWWSSEPNSACRNGSIAWEGTNVPAARFNSRVRLFRRSWENPHPDRPLQSIDLVAEDGEAVPFLVAVTLDP